jgi:hypothetical protein
MKWVDLSALCTFAKEHSNSAGKMYFTHLPKENKIELEKSAEIHCFSM